MLWIPDKKTLKKIRRQRRLRRRRQHARLLLFTLLIFVLTAASVPPQHDLDVQLERVTTAHRFDFVDWLSQALASEVGRQVSQPATPAALAERQALIQTYLAQEAEIDHLEETINQAYAGPNSARAGRQTLELEQDLAQLRQDQAALAPAVETILSDQIEAVLRDEGLTTLGGVVLPPVAFRLVEPPTVLILSPRDEIKREHFVALEPGLGISQRAAIEAALDRRGDVASYITDIGGLGSYPTMVIGHPWLPALIDIAAHEWVHNYLYTFPTNMAWGYQTYPRLTTINETTASLVGEEISRKVITRFYPDWVEQLPPLDEQGQPAPAEPSEFHLAMRRIRQHVDVLLAEGKVAEAEAYMETERLQLVEQGYTLRRLNQAYFAFHGSYALSPGSVDPIGPQLRQLRAASPSLQAFLERVGWLNSYADYLAWLEELEQ